MKHSKGPFTPNVMPHRVSIYASDGVLAEAIEGDRGKEIQRANTELLALADTAPHECEDPECPGVVNKAKLEQFAALVEEVKRLREQWDTRINTLCGNCGKRYLGPRDDRLHGIGKCEELP